MKSDLIRKAAGRKRKAAAAAAAAAVLLGAFFLSRGMTAGTPVHAAEAVRQDVSDSYTEEGRITAGETKNYIAGVSGPVEEVCVEENRRVKKGEILFRISDSAFVTAKESADSEAAGYRAQLEQTKISQLMTAAPTEYVEGLDKKKAAADAALKAAKASYEASAALLASGTVSQNDQALSEAAYRKAAAEAEEAELRCRESREMLKKLQETGVGYEDINRLFYESETERISAAVSAAETEASYQEDQIRKCTVTADKDGIVTSLPVRDLSYIAAGQTAVTVSGAGKLSAEADVLTAAVPYIRKGDPVSAEISLKGKNMTLNGSVTEVYDYAEQKINALGLEEYRVHVKAELDEGAADASHGLEGYGADLKFTLYSGENVLTVPAGAVFEWDGKEYVYRISGGRAVMQEVVTEYKTAACAVIADGLNEGDMVVREADTEGVYDGARVRVHR